MLEIGDNKDRPRAKNCGTSVLAIFYPGYFASVMATGVVSLADRTDGGSCRSRSTAVVPLLSRDDSASLRTTSHFISGFLSRGSAPYCEPYSSSGSIANYRRMLPK